MKQEKQQEIALMRYGAIAPIIAGLDERYPSKTAFYAEISAKGIHGPDGELHHYAPSTIEKWYLDYQNLGFDGLIPKGRADAGMSRKLDEANYIGNAVLNDLKMLFNFEMDSKDRAVVLLSGLPQLNSTLRLSIHEPFRQRIVMNYNLEGITKAEGHSYVTAKLAGAGCTQAVFEESALEAILNAANGTPRMINKLCNASLLVGSSANLNIINTDAVMQAINDCELG